MQKRVIRTKSAAPPGGAYSQAVAVGNLVFTAGMVGVDPKTGRAPKGIVGQTRQALRNLQATLEASGTDLDHVVRASVFLTNMKEFAGYDKAYREFFKRDPPARTTIQAELAGDYLVEINLIAAIP